MVKLTTEVLIDCLLQRTWINMCYRVILIYAYSLLLSVLTTSPPTQEEKSPNKPKKKELPTKDWKRIDSESQKPWTQTGYKMLTSANLVRCIKFEILDHYVDTIENCPSNYTSKHTYPVKFLTPPAPTTINLWNENEA